MFLRVRQNFSSRMLFVLAVFLAGAIAVEGADQRQRRSKVIFSDTKEPSSLPIDATQPQSRKGAEEILSPGSSLGGVIAPPFASPMVAPQSLRPLTGRGALDQNKDWLIKSVENMNASEDAAAKALGVRDFGTESGFLMDENSKKGMFEKENSFLGTTSDDKLGPKSGESLKKSQTRTEDRWRSFSPAASGQNPLMPVVSGGSSKSDAGISTFEERKPVFFSDSDTVDLVGRGMLDDVGGAARAEDVVRSALNPVGASDTLGVFRRGMSDRGSGSAGPRDEFRALLGLEKSGSAVPGRELIGGAGDLVNTKPDLTRQEINPVAPRSGASVGSAELPSFQENPLAAAQQNPLRLPGFDNLPSRAFGAPVAESSLAPVIDLPKRTISPTVLPVPKRSF